MEVSSAYTPTTTVTMTNTSGDWWLRDLDDPTNNMKLFVSDNGLHGSSDASQASFDVLNRADYVVISDSIKAYKLSIKSEMFAADRIQFEEIRNKLQPVLLQSDYGRQWYIKFDNFSFDMINTNQEFQTTSIAAVEVARPAP